MDNTGAILIFVVFLQQTNFILSSYIIPKDVFKTIELISGSKNQYISLQDQKRYSVKDVIQHYFIELNNLKIRKRGLLGKAIWVVKFSKGGYKIRKIFAQESTYPKQMIEF